MKYYKIKYKTGKQGEYIYPQVVKNVVWTMTQYHVKNKVMIGGTESELSVDGKEAAALSEKAALKLIEEFKKSYPQVSEKGGPG